MDPELLTLLILLAVSAPSGLVIGVFIRKKCPEFSKRYTKYCMHRKWWIYGFGVILFSGLAAQSYLSDNPYFAAVFISFAVLEAFAFFWFGFRRLTPEMEKRIDESDPTKLWPIRLYKHGRNV